MAITLTNTNHYKSQKHKGEVRLKGQAHNVSLTFANSPGKITFPANVSTYGLEVGDRIKTNSANAANVGPFYIKAISTVDATVMTAAGADPTLTAGTEAGLTCGTYLVKCLLTRSGFVFNKDDHAQLMNIKADTTAMTLSIVASAAKIIRVSGSFITDGFVPNNAVTLSGFTNGGNNVAKIISTVSALEVVFTSATGLVDETGGGDERMISNDELATGGGYTQNTKLTGVVTVSEDDMYDRSDATFPTVTITASGSNIGPTPGCLFHDSVSDTIISNLDFGGEQTASPPDSILIGNGTFRIA